MTPKLQPPKSLDHVLAQVQYVSKLGRTALQHPEDVKSHLELVRRKLPSVVDALKTISKSDKTEALSIGQYLARNGRERPHGAAILYEDQRITHRELDENANRYADLFAKQGIQKGEPVAIMLENRPELLFAVAGAVKLGAIAAVINTNQRKHVLEHSFSVCGAKLFVIGEEVWEAFEDVRGDLPAATAARVLFVADTGEAAVPNDTVDVASSLRDASPAPRDELDTVTLGDPCFYIYTSGTTGLPKASIMSHFRWVKAAAAFGQLALDLQPEDVLYVPLPFYHNNALTVSWASAATRGAAIAMRRKFSVSRFWDDVRKFNATAFCYIGELCRYLMNQPENPSDRDNPVTRIVGNGLRPDIWRAFKKRFGIEEVYEFYAASEGNIAFVNVLNFDCTVGVCPAPYALVEYDIDEDQPIRTPDGRLKRVKPGGVGLLIGKVSEKYAFDGYTDAKASEKKLLRNVFEDGDVWFNSGDLLKDLGFRHAQFVDRVGDTFRWKGENVSTNEVAEVCNQFPQVSETTVYGVQVPGMDGRAGMAAVVSRVPMSELDLDGFAKHAHGELPSYAVPRFLRFRTELEITGTFKQKKSSLRSDGFDPEKVDEPLYVVRPDGKGFEPLTPAIFEAIGNGTRKL